MPKEILFQSWTEQLVFFLFSLCVYIIVSLLITPPRRVDRRISFFTFLESLTLGNVHFVRYMLTHHNATLQRHWRSLCSVSALAFSELLYADKLDASNQGVHVPKCNKNEYSESSTTAD